MYATDAKVAEAAIRSMYGVLLDGLPIDDLLPALIQKKVLVRNQSKEINTPSDRIPKNVYLLREIIIPSLKAKVTIKFDLLLQAMEECEDLTCQSLATDLSTICGKRPEISLEKIIPPSGNYCYDINKLCYVVLLKY